MTKSSASPAARRILITALPPCRRLARHGPPSSTAAARAAERAHHHRLSHGETAGDARLPDRLRARSMDLRRGAAGGAELVSPAGRRDQTNLRLFLPRHERRSERAYFRARLRQCARRRRVRRSPTATRISVQYGWHGTPEEQGFLHDVQAAACEEFTTVLAPGANVYHYNHIHVDLMRHYKRPPHLRAVRISPAKSSPSARGRATPRSIPASRWRLWRHRLDQTKPYAPARARLFRRGRRHIEHRAAAAFEGGLGTIYRQPQLQL
jgi:hypothetical protein